MIALSNISNVITEFRVQELDFRHRKTLWTQTRQLCMQVFRGNLKNNIDDTLAKYHQGQMVEIEKNEWIGDL